MNLLYILSVSLFFILPHIAHSYNYLPIAVQNCPKADEIGIVHSTKRVSIEGIPYLYNASITTKKDGSGYLLFFRVDTPHIPPFVSHIVCAELDHEFNQKNIPVTTLNTGSEHSEDPRALWVEDELWVVYNDEGSMPSQRIMKSARLNPTTLEVLEIFNLDIGLKKAEKNWVPFSSPLTNIQGENLCFGYTVTPHVVFKLDEIISRPDNFVSLFSENEHKILWPRVWGPIRGGTPAQRISDDEYLAFFHSSFIDGHKTRWYIIGAYTFDAEAPYEITGISSFPLLFKGIYDTPSYRTDLNVLFPAGFVIEAKDEGDLIHLSCGENDLGAKIITLNKDALLKSLRPATPIRKKSFRRLCD